MDSDCILDLLFLLFPLLGLIQTIEGKIGGGKTYTAMGWICNHLAKGGVVATNINIQAEPFEDQFGKKIGIREVLKRHFSYVLKDEQIIHLSDFETLPYPGPKGIVQLNQIVMFYKVVPRGTPEMPLLVVIDEAHIHFPNDGYRNIPREVVNFLTLSRHASVDIVFISQHIKNMWCQMTRLAEFRWDIRDMKKFGIQWGVFNFPWLFPHFKQVKYDSCGDVMSFNMEWKRNYLFETYKSPEIASKFESMPTAAKVEIERAGLSMKDKLIIFGAGFMCALLLLAVPACKVMNAKSEPVRSEPVKKQADLQIGKKPVKKQGKGIKDQPEYFQCYSSSSAGFRFYTSKRVYQAGDTYQGAAVVNAEKNNLICMTETGDMFRVYFESAPLKERALVNEGGVR